LAEAVKVYAQKYMHLEQTCCQISEVSLRAARRAGELLHEMEGIGTHGGNRKSSNTMLLENSGVTKTQTHRWQRIAAIADDRFESYVESCLAKNKPCTAASLRNERRLWPSSKCPVSSYSMGSHCNVR
jgi:hypothetical protein